MLIVVGIASATGTLVLQRPLADPGEIERSYSPQVLRWLDALGLTDVFHTWWFAALLALLAVNIVAASLERLPVAWRYFARPYRHPEPHFLMGLKMQQAVAIHREQCGVEAAERAFHEMGFKAQRGGCDGNLSLFAERNRFARLAPYLVHASLLLIFSGAIADSLWGYRGFMALRRGDQSNEIELHNGARKPLPFTIRCNAAGQENYDDGTPRRWWSRLTVIENGREARNEEIQVNKPLVYRGLRFYQSSYGATGRLDTVRLTATPKSAGAAAREILLAPDQAVELDPNTRVRLAAFVPDFVVVDNQVQTRSREPRNPAIQLAVESEKSGAARVWLFPRFPDFGHPDRSPYAFQVRDVEMGYFTGLQVAYEPGQWAVWTGVVLMGFGLALAFYFVHVRVWAVPVNDGRGRLVLWVGASASKNREEFEKRFRKLVGRIEEELVPRCRACEASRSGSPATAQG